jgi:predicted SAM-dependent methyltransferase
VGLNREKLLKVHVGCGKNYLDGWVNTDISGKYDAYWDLMGDAAPFEKGEVDAFFMEHVLEHFTLKDGIKILIKMSSYLKKGGVLRVVVPSLESLIDGYLNDTDFLVTNNSLFPNKKLAFKAQLVNQTFYGFGHKNMFDKQLMRFALRSAKFNVDNEFFFENDEIGNTVFSGVGRRIYKSTSSVKNISVEVVKS